MGIGYLGIPPLLRKDYFEQAKEFIKGFRQKCSDSSYAVIEYSNTTNAISVSSDLSNSQKVDQINNIQKSNLDARNIHLALAEATQTFEYFHTEIEMSLVISIIFGTPTEEELAGDAAHQLKFQGERNPVEHI